MRTCEYTGVYIFPTKDQHLSKSTSVPGVEACFWENLDVANRAKRCEVEAHYRSLSRLMTLIKVEETAVNTEMIFLGNWSTRETYTNCLGSCFSGQYFPLVLGCDVLIRIEVIVPPLKNEAQKARLSIAHIFSNILSTNKVGGERSVFVNLLT